MPHIQSGQLKPLAVFTPERIRALPEVPTFKELGSLPYDGGTTAAVLAPAGTSKDVGEVVDQQRLVTVWLRF